MTSAHYRDIWYLSLSRLWPRSFLMSCEQLWNSAGKTGNLGRSLGEITLLTLLGMLITLLLPWSLHVGHASLYVLLSFFIGCLILFLYYLHLYFIAEKRISAVEERLPDFLELVASNLKAGIAPYQAMQLAAKEDFGVLSTELELALQKSRGEQSFGVSLNNIAEHLHSDLLQRTMQLFIISLKSGASLAPLLEQLARDVRETKNLEKQMATSTKTYTALIMFTVVFAMPLLLAVTLYFLETMRATLDKVSLPTSDFGLSLLMGEIAVSPAFLQVVAYVLLGVTCLLTCLLLGIIGKGKARLGLVYFPFLVVGSYLLFLVAQYVIQSLLGSFA